MRSNNYVQYLSDWPNIIIQDSYKSQSNTPQMKKTQKQKQLQSCKNTLPITAYMIPKDKPSRSRVTKQKQNENKNHKNNKHIDNYHESSREGEVEECMQQQQRREDASKTQPLVSEKDQKQIDNQWDINGDRIVQVCNQMLLIAPRDVGFFQGKKKRIKQIIQGYTRDQVLEFIADNAKYDGVANLKNLQKVDDDKFWKQTVPSLLRIVGDDRKQKSISACIRTLVPDQAQIVELSRMQVLIIISNMFFSLIPRQSTRKSPYNLTHLMYIPQTQSATTSSTKYQKLLCLINYLKQATKMPQKRLQNEKIQIQRSLNRIHHTQYTSISYKLSNVEVAIGKIEERYKWDLLIDFANQSIGGGVLNRGAVQEEILFLCFPELIVTMLLCFKMKDHEAIVVYGANRFNRYDGYSDSFQFLGNFQQKQDQVGPFQSVIIAVDATDYKSCQSHQYQYQSVHRELKKFLLGIQAADFSADENMKVCTGRWGCGAFAGNNYLKFLIQWIACSVANRDMVYMAQTQEQKNQLQIMIKFMKKFETTDILEIIEQFGRFSGSRNKQMQFLDFVKKYSS